MTIGVLSDWPGTSAYHNEILRGVEDYGRSAGISIITLAVGRFGSELPTEKGRRDLYEIIRGNTLSGLVVYTASVGTLTGPDPLFDALKKLSGRPMVSLSIPREGHPSVVIDNRSGFTDLCRHIIVDHKYTDIVYLSGPADNYDCCIRFEVLGEMMAGHNLPFGQERIWHGDLTARSGGDGIRHFVVDRGMRPRAIICANDYMAIGAWEEAKALGMSLPWDTAVTGFDNIEMSHWFELPFTTVRQPFYQQGFIAAQLLHDTLLGRKVPALTEIPSKLVRRESCGCLFRESEGDRSVTVDKSPMYRILHGERLDEAFKRFLDGKPGDPLIRAWNAFINETRVLDLKEAEVRRYFNEISERFCALSLPPAKKSELGKNLLRMQQILGDYYKEADLFGKVIQGVTLESMMEGIDNFTQWLINSGDPSSQSERLRDLFLSLDIKNAWLVFYGDQQKPFQSPARCSFAMTDGILHPEPQGGADFDPAGLIPDDPACPDWSSLLVEALYEGDDKIGYLVYDNRMWDADTNEMLRRRLSTGLRAVKINRHLSETNESLEQEIRLRRESEEKLMVLMEELKNLSLKDELTGLFNRRGFLTIGEQQIKHYIREEKDFLILFADMDGLKAINDSMGHQEGDMALQTAARILEASFRDADIVARLGGDEFTVLLGSAGLHNVELFEERVAKTSTAMTAGFRKNYKISLSLGFVAASEYPGATLRELLDHADKKLYDMKKVRKTGHCQAL
jgi:diguanylate cyclase (GGDEF)-like protein